MGTELMAFAHHTGVARSAAAKRMLRKHHWEQQCLFAETWVAVQWYHSQATTELMRSQQRQKMFLNIGIGGRNERQ